MKLVNFYSVLVDGECIFTGSQSQCKMVYDSLQKFFSLFIPNSDFVVVIAYPAVMPKK